MVATFKIITLASSVEEGVVDLFKDTYFDSGAINVEGSTLHCWKHGGHGAQTYLEVVENSCNLYAEQEILKSYLREFRGVRIILTY